MELCCMRKGAPEMEGRKEGREIGRRNWKRWKGMAVVAQRGGMGDFVADMWGKLTLMDGQGRKVALEGSVLLAGN